MTPAQEMMTPTFRVCLPISINPVNMTPTGTARGLKNSSRECLKVYLLGNLRSKLIIKTKRATGLE